MPKKGYVSPNRFSPRKGDIYEEIIDADAGDGISWEVQREHAWIDDKTGKTIKYYFIIGHHAEFGDEPIPLIVNSSDMDPAKFLARFTRIHRLVRGGKTVVYEKRPDTGTFEEL